MFEILSQAVLIKHSNMSGINLSVKTVARQCTEIAVSEISFSLILAEQLTVVKNRSFILSTVKLR